MSKRSSEATRRSTIGTGRSITVLRRSASCTMSRLARGGSRCGSYRRSSCRSEATQTCQDRRRKQVSPFAPRKNEKNASFAPAKGDTHGLAAPNRSRGLSRDGENCEFHRARKTEAYGQRGTVARTLDRKQVGVGKAFACPRG